MSTHYSILAWEIQRTLVGYSPWGQKESDVAKRLTTHIHTHIILYMEKIINITEYWKSGTGQTPYI